MQVHVNQLTCQAADRLQQRRTWLAVCLVRRSMTGWPCCQRETDQEFLRSRIKRPGDEWLGESPRSFGSRLLRWITPMWRTLSKSDTDRAQNDPAERARSLERLDVSSSCLLSCLLTCVLAGWIACWLAGFRASFVNPSLGAVLHFRCACLPACLPACLHVRWSSGGVELVVRKVGNSSEELNQRSLTFDCCCGET